MANEIGSFVVNIRAQIEGYQEQINAIKAKLAEVGKDTDIGKEIAKSLKLAESQVERLGKTMEKRISSESQITALTDNLQNISRLIMDIGDSFGKVTWDDLNVDGLRDKIQSTKSEIDDLTNSIQENVSKGFTEALATSVEMREVFKTLKINPAQMGVDEVSEKLRIGLAAAAADLQKYKTELEDIAQKADEANQKMSNIGLDKSKAENAKSSLNDIFNSLQIIVTESTSVNGSKTDDFFMSLKEKCDDLYLTVDAKGKDIVDKIREISLGLLGETDPSKIKENLQQINDFFKELNGKSLAANIEGYGTRIESIFKNLTTTDIQQSINGLKEFKTALEDLFADNKNFGMNPTDAKNFIEKIINIDATKESIDAAKKEVSALITNYLNEVSQTYKEASQTASSFRTSKNTAQKRYDETNARNEAIKTAEAQYKAEVERLSKENEGLNKRLSEVENILKQLQSDRKARNAGNNNPMKNFGDKQKGTAIQALNESTKAAGRYNAQLEQVKAREQAIGNIQSFVQRWFSVYAAARLISNAFKSMKTNLQDLDDIMTQISIVTDKTQGDLWKQMPQYTDMAKQYASSIKGVYEVSQLYYQQGLGQNDVMALTEQTLKMAKISGLEYATATDYMTNAVRSFKMEMSDAQQVVDVYSAIAASSATNTAELATAMSKTASSAQAVDSSFENTTAMMAVMIEATRESAENIGSAMKSIISRYGEMTKSPSKLIDSEGEAMSLNKVDTALQTVGISIHDAQGQFRDFDDVITELSGSWDKIDKNTQRYIATVMAGNRQQSRFLALVSNGERLQELTEEAANAEDTATLQVLKTMDSISAKAQQLQTSLQGLYTEGGFENLYKHILDLSKNVIDTFTGMPKLFGDIPVTAIAMFAQLFINIGGLLTQGLSKLKNHFTNIKDDLTNKIESGSRLGVQSAQQHANSLAKMFESAAVRIQNALSSAIIKGTNPSILNSNNANNAFQKIEIDKKTMSPAEQYKARLSNKLGELKRNNSKAGQVAGMSQEEREQLRQNAIAAREAQRAQAINTTSEALRGFGAVLQIVSMAMDKTTRSGEIAAGAINLVGGAAATAGYALTGNYAMAAMTAATTIISSLDMLAETAEKRAARLKKASEEANNEFLQKNNDFKELDNQIKKLKELEKAQYDSEEAKKEYIEASNQIAEKNPELISGFDSEGNAIINLSASYEQLANARKEASDAADEVIKTSIAEAEDAIQTAKENRTKNRHETMQKAGAKKYDDDFSTTNSAALYYSWEAASKGIEGLNEQAKDNIANLLSNLGNQNWNTVDLMLENKDVQNALSTLQTNTSELGKTVYNIISSYISGLKDIDRDIAQKENNKIAIEQTDLLKKIDNDNLGKKDEAMANNSKTVLDELSEAGLLIDNYMLKAFENWKKEMDKKEPGKNHKGGYESELERFINDEYEKEYERIYQQLEQLWNTGDNKEDTQSKIKNLLKNRKNYTLKQMQEEIDKILGVPEGADNFVIADAISGFYKENQSFTLGEFNKAIAKRREGKDDFLKIITESGKVTENLGETELQQILNIYDDIDTKVANGLDLGDGQEILNAYMSVWEATQNINDTASQEIAQNLLSSVEDLSLTELYQLKDNISEADIPDSYKSEINSAIDNLIKVAPANIAIEFTTFADDIVAHSEDFSKALNSASKGMDLKDASEMATKLDASLSDFDFKSGKYFFKDANALQEAYSDYNKDLLSDLQNRYDEQVKELESSKEGKSESEIADIDTQIDQMTKAKDNAESAIKQWMNYEVNSALLQAGQLSAFLDNLEIKGQDNQDIAKQITSGNIEKALLEHPELADYTKVLIETYKSINTNINSSLTSSIKDGAQFIEKTDLNADKFKSLGNLATEVKNANGEIIGYYVEVTKENVNEYIKWVKDNAENLTQNDIKSSLKEAHDLQFPDVASALQGITSDSVSYDAMQNFVEAIGENAENIDEVARQYGFTVDTITGNFIRGNSTLTALQNKLTELQAEGTDIKAINAVATQIDTLKNQSQRNALEAAKTILSKQTEVTEDNIQNFADSLGIAYDEMKAAFTMQNNGYYKADMGAIASKMAEAGVAIDSFITQLFDSAIAAIQGNADIMTSGFSNVESTMTDFTELRDLTGEDLKFTDIYRLDSILHKYVYTTEGLIIANNARSEAIAKQYEDAITGLENSQMDISDEGFSKFLENNSGQFKDYYQAWKAYIAEQKAMAQQSKEAADALTGELDNIEFEKIDFSGIADGTISFAEAQNQLISYIAAANPEEKDQDKIKEMAEQLYNQLASGGKEAIEAYYKNGGKDQKVAQALYEGNNAAQEILDAIKGKADNATIVLTDAWKKVLGVDKDKNTITAGEIKAPEMLAKLFEAIGIKVQEGKQSIEDYNADVMQVINESDSSKTKASTEALSSVISDFNASTLEALANSLGIQLKQGIDIEKAAGTTEGVDGKKIISNIEEFLNWVINNADGETAKFLQEYKEAIKSGITISSQISARSSVVQANITELTAVEKELDTEINNLISAKVGDYVDISTLLAQYSEKSGGDAEAKSRLAADLGVASEDIENGYLQISNKISSGVWGIISNLFNRNFLPENIETNTQELQASAIQSAISATSSFQVGSVIDAETVKVLQNAGAQLNVLDNGTAVINSAQEYIDAVKLIYDVAKKSFEQNTTDLATLNNSFANLIKANNSQDSAVNSMLSSAANLSVDTLNNFATGMGRELEDFIDESGKPLLDNIERVGIDSYQVTNWQDYIAELHNKLGISIDNTTQDYINAYIAWLDSEANVAPNPEEALMTSLIPNLEKLSYAEIGQIAKTFKMTVEQVLALVENNGDNTFNAKDLLNVLPIDKTNEEFARALSTQLQSVTSNMTSAMIAFVEAGADGNRTNLDFSNLKNAISDFEKGMQALGQNVSVQNLVLALTQGGETAVAAAEQIAALSGQELSASDVATLYQGQVSKLVNAVDTVVSQPGEIVDAVTASIISQSGGQVSQLGTTGQYVVESAANLYEAYNNLLQKMAATGEATLADLNNVAAKALENRDGEQQIIDALGDASNMTYTRFGEILAQQGIELTEQLVDSMANAGIIKQLGGANMAITDFKGLADIFDWDANSEQFVSAFKTYNDSLIEMNRQVERNILEEAQSVADVQGGDWINLTQLTNKMQETYEKALESPTAQTSSVINPLTALNEKLKDYGAYIEDGILKIGETADIPAIMQAVAQAAAESGGLLSNEMAQLADTVADAIKSYADLISGGIEGSLTNTQAEQLQDWANKNGVGQLDFTPTEKGLKVATSQAQKLVAALKKVDSIQGKLTFDKMVEALSADKGGKFNNISKTTAEIAKLNREYEKNAETIKTLQEAQKHADASGKDNIGKEISRLEEKNSKLKEQIGLYREIQQAQSIDPSQYDFMNRDIPEVMQGPINYWNSVGQAFAAMNEAGQTGKMAINDFYNIINEMENLANISGEAFNLAGYQIGGEASEAARLIQDGLGSLTNIDGKGVKVDLSKLGIDFVSGADNAKQNFADGVNALAESQIAMLDAAIKVLEIVVAMENLGDISVDDNPEFSFGDVFDLGSPPSIDEQGNEWYNFTEEFNTWRENIVSMLTEGSDNYNADLAAAAESIKVNGVSLKEMLESGANTIKELGITQQEYFEILKAFQTAAASGDYDLDNIQESVWEILKNSGLTSDMQIDVGDYTLTVNGSHKALINWKEPNTQEAVAMAEKKYKETEEEAKERLKEAFRKFEQGKNQDPIETLLVLHAKNEIELTFDKEGNPKIKMGDKEIDPKSVEGQEIIAKAALEAKGIKEEDIFGEKIDYSKEGNPVTISAHTKIGDMEVIAEVDGEGNVTYRDTKYGLTSNSLEELEQAMVEKFISENSNDENGAPTELQARQALFGMTVKPRVEVKTELDTPQLKQQAVKVAQMSTDKLKELIEEENNNYEILEPTKKGYVRFNLDGIEVEVEDTGDFEANLAAAQEKVAGLVEGIDLVGKISEAIKDAFTNDNSIGEAIGEGIASSLSNYTITIDPTTGKIKIVKLGEAVEGAANAEPTPEVKKSADVTANAEEGNTEVEGMNEAVEAAVKALKDIIIPSVDAKVGSLNITGVDNADMGSSGLIDKISSFFLGDKSITIPSVNATVSNLNINSVGSANYQAGENITPPKIPTLDGEVTTLNVTPSSSPVIKTDGLKASEITSPLEANATVNATPSAAPTIINTAGLTSTIDSLNATITTLKASASNVDASEASSSIISKIEEALNSKEFKIKIGIDLGDGGESKSDSSSSSSSTPTTPSVGDGGLSGLAAAINTLSSAASSAAGQLGVVSAALLLAKSDELVAASTATITAKSEELTNASKATTDAKASELVNASKATTDAKSAEMSNAMHAINDTQATKVVTATGAINNINTTPATNARAAINGISSTGAGKAKEAINNINSGPAAAAKSALNSISVDLPGSKETDVTLRYKVSKTSAKGNIGNFAKAKGSGPAKVGGSTKTLMGELGPELVVSNGRYFIAGANGAEFVDLANDAIVFNHLQTRRLMSQGAIGGRGRPTTNEREAVAFAKGKVSLFGPARETGEDQDSKQQAQQKRESEKITSVSVSPSSHTFHSLVRFKSRAKGTGPAMASASEALALLKQLRAMWQSLADASLADMGGNAGRGGGGGGGGGSGNDKDRENYYAGINEAVDRWYNWLKKIEDTQIRINKLTKEYNLLEKEGLSTEEKLANLQKRQEDLKSNKETRDQLVKEQKDVRADLIKSANKGLFSAFYEADPETGLISLKNDESFVNFLKATDDNGSNKELIKQIQDGQSIANKTITRKYSDTELKEIGARKFDDFNLKETINAKQLKGLSKTQKKFYEKTTDKNGKTVYKLKSDARENYAEAWKNSQKKNNKDNKPITLTRDIKTGLDFISELQATDEAGNLIHDAADQLSLIKAMGLWTEDLELGIDKEQDGWEQQVVERFFGKIDQDKSDIEGLTDSINEQEEASLDDAIAIQEINDQIRELLTPVTGVTDGLTKWYNETQKIKAAQAEINKLTKELSLLQNDFIANGFEIFKNYKDQEDSLNRQNKINDELLKKRKSLAGDLTNKYSGLINKGIISVDENGTATFSDSKVNKGEIQTSYQQIVTNDQGYQIDEEGKYVDDKGVLRDKEGKKITDENAHFGVLKYEEVTGRSYNTTGKSFEQIIEDITSQNALGEVAYNAEEQYQILKSLGLEDFMKYDEKGNQIYDDFGELSKEDMQKAVEAGIKRIQGSVDEINKNNDEITNLEQEQLEIQSQLQSIQKALIDNQIEVENLVKDAVVQEHQDAIDAKKSFAEAISEAASRTIEGMRKDLDNEKQTYESDKDNKELTLLRMQLTTAQMSGNSVSKIRDLQKQIQDKQQQMYFDEREKLISELEDQTNETVEALNDQTEIAQTALDYQVKYGEIWEEVNEKLTKSPEALVDFISKNQPDFLSKSETERKTLLTNIRDKVETFSSDIKYQELSDERDSVLSDAKYSDERFKSADVMKSILEAGQKVFLETEGSIEEKFVAAREAMVKKADEYYKSFGLDKPLIQESQPVEVESGPSEKLTQEQPEEIILDESSFIEPEISQDIQLEQETPSEEIEPKKEVVFGATPEPFDPEKIWEKNRKLKYDKDKSVPGIYEIFGKTKKIIKGNKDISNQEAYAILKDQYLKLLLKGKTESQIADSWNKVTDKTIKAYLIKGMKELFNKTVAFKRGGDIDFTGPAWVDGTKNEPEHIFNFKQMEALRAHLLSGVDTTARAVAGLSNIIESLPNVNTYNNINNDNSGINIHNLEFHMEVKEISNDYDARRAGQQAMEEMVRIAYKAGNRSISRR